MSIVIPTLNEAQYLPRLLDSLGASQLASELQIIVSDGQSTDRTRAIARTHAASFGSLIVLNNLAGVGRQRNEGAKRASSKILLFLDADIVMPDYALEAFHITPRSASFTTSFSHRAFGETSPADRFALQLIDGLIRFASLASLPVTNGDALGIDSATFAGIGGFREDLLLGEDTDLGLRAKKAGATHYRLRAPVYASPRRVRRTGHVRLGSIWIYAFIRVLLGHPIRTANARISYPFGNFGGPVSRDDGPSKEVKPSS